jgi:hypothetical protein
MRGVQKASSSVTASMATGRNRVNGLLDVSTTTALTAFGTPSFMMPR